MNIIALKQSAERLRILLLKYATHNEDAVSALRQYEPIIEDIRSGKICEPNQVLLSGYYFSTESSLFEHRDVCEEAALLAMYMEGWSSEEEFNLEMKKVMKHANIEERQLSESAPNNSFEWDPVSGSACPRAPQFRRYTDSYHALPTL